MTYMECFCKDRGIEVTREQVAAAKYLESVGMRFLIDFGYGNASEKAMTHFVTAPAPKVKH